MTLTIQGGADWAPEKIELLKNTICKGSTNDEFQLFLMTCKRTGLDPFARQLHAVKRWDGSLKREVMTIQTGIDGYRLIAERTGCYAPGREPTYAYDKDGNLLSATAYVKKMTKDGTWHEIAATAYYAEYVQTTKDGNPTRFWKQMPHGQLSKCAEALALRKAFPQELSGIYTTEEMAQAQNETPMQASERQLSQEEIATFLESYGEDKEAICQYAEHVSQVKEWSMNKTMLKLMEDPAKTRSAFAIWLAKEKAKNIEIEIQSA